MRSSMRSCSPRRSRGRVEDAPRPGTCLLAGVPILRLPRPWTRAGSHRFPGDPSHASALLPDPGRADEASPMAASPTPPPVFQHRRPQRLPRFRGSLTRLQHPPSTLHVRVAASVQDWLPAGGLRLCREGVKPPGSLRKVSGHIDIPLSRSYPVAMEEFGGKSAGLPGRWGRCRPHPPQTRTCGFPASGSSRERFARGGVSMGDLGWRQGVAFQDCAEARPGDDASAISPRQPFPPYPHDLAGVALQPSTVAADAVVGEVAPHHRGQVAVLVA